MRLSNKIKTFDISLLEKSLKTDQLNREAYRVSVLAKMVKVMKKYFIKKPVVKSVYLFGSVLTKNHFTKRSDIDIAVRGLESTLFFRTHAELNFLVFEHNVDLIEMEYCDFKDKIIKSGKRII